MAIILTETDTAGTCSVSNYCNSGLIVNSSTTAKKATSGGTAGTTAVSVTIDASGVGNSDLFVGFTSANNEPNNCSWESGTWTFRIEITTANMNITSWDCMICRLTSGCVNAGTVVSEGFGTGDFSTTGVKSGTASGSAQAGASSTDLIFVALGAGAGTMTQTFGYKPSQNIDTPINQNANCSVSPPGNTTKFLMLMGVGT